MKKRYLFVCGVARSGTSMMVDALNQSPQVVIGMERYIKRYFEEGKLDKSLFVQERFLDVRQGDTHYDSLSAFAGGESVATKYGSCEVVGDKIPRLFESIPMLIEQFDTPKIIFMLRNVFDVAASFKARAENIEDRLWPRTRDARAALEEWNRALAIVLPFARSGQVHVVPYEDAVSSPMRYAPLAAPEEQGMRAVPMEVPWRRLERYLGVPIPVPTPRPRAASRRCGLSAEEREAVREGADWDSYAQLIDLARPVDIPDRYSEDDAALIDYHATKVPGIRFKVRAGGPPTTVFLGSAAAFGRFVERPYPALVGGLNLGFGGARPETYLSEPGALGRIAQADATIIEVMSARGYENSLFRPLNALGNFVLLKNEWQLDPAFEKLQRPSFIEQVWQRAFLRHPDRAREWIRECQLSWIEDTRTLAERSRAPWLLWISQRPPVEDCRENLDYFFPHLVDRWCLRQLDLPIIHVVSTRGLPQELRDAHGKSLPLLVGSTTPSTNTYYPSPEMHELAAETIRATLARGRALTLAAEGRTLT